MADEPRRLELGHEHELGMGQPKYGLLQRIRFTRQCDRAHSV